MWNSVINWLEQWLADIGQNGSSGRRDLNLETILFLAYVNELEEGVTRKHWHLRMTLIFFMETLIKEQGDKQEMQNDIDKLAEW